MGVGFVALDAARRRYGDTATVRAGSDVFSKDGVILRDMMDV